MQSMTKKSSIRIGYSKTQAIERMCPVWTEWEQEACVLGHCKTVYFWNPEFSDSKPDQQPLKIVLSQEACLTAPCQE